MAKMTKRKKVKVELKPLPGTAWLDEYELPGGHMIHPGDKIRSTQEKGSFKIVHITLYEEEQRVSLDGKMDIGHIDCYGGDSSGQAFRSIPLQFIRLAARPRSRDDKGKKLGHKFPGSFGEQFRIDREDLKVNRKQVADLAGMTVAAVAGIETRREPSDEEQTALEAALIELGG
jgi:hypothetical protein